MASCKGFTREGARGRIGKDPICGRCKRRKSEHGARPTKAAPATAKAPRKPKGPTLARVKRLKKVVAEKRRTIKRAGTVAVKIARMLEQTQDSLDGAFSDLAEVREVLAGMLLCRSQEIQGAAALEGDLQPPTPSESKLEENRSEKTDEQAAAEADALARILEPSVAEVEHRDLERLLLGEVESLPVPPKAPELMMAAILLEDD